MEWLPEVQPKLGSGKMENLVQQLCYSFLLPGPCVAFLLPFAPILKLHSILSQQAVGGI